MGCFPLKPYKIAFSFSVSSSMAAFHRQIGELYASVGRLIEKGSFKDALERIFDFVRSANKFFDARQPWIARTADRKACEDTLYQLA